MRVTLSLTRDLHFELDNEGNPERAEGVDRRYICVHARLGDAETPVIVALTAKEYDALRDAYADALEETHGPRKAARILEDLNR